MTPPFYSLPPPLPPKDYVILWFLVVTVTIYIYISVEEVVDMHNAVIFPYNIYPSRVNFSIIAKVSLWVMCLMRLTGYGD